MKAKVIRITRLNSNGGTQVGSDDSVVSSSLITLVVTPEYEEGEEIVVKDADGNICTSYKDPNKLKRITFEMAVCRPDPYMHEILAGGDLMTSGSAVGYAMPEVGEDATPNGVSIEVWARNVDAAGAPDPDYTYAWYVLPRVYGQLGAKRFAVAPQDIAFSGHGVQNTNWGNGPQNDHPVPSLTGRLLSWIPTNDAPTASCGYTATIAS